MDILNALRQEWPVISHAPWSFGIALAVAIAVIYGLMQWRYSAIIDRQDHELASYRQKEQIESQAATDSEKRKGAVAIPDNPELKISMLGGNIFVPDAPDLHDQYTGIALVVRIWNTGKPSIATSWSLVVVPQGQQPVVAQFTKIPDQLRAGGQLNSAVIRASDDLDPKTIRAPVTDIPLQGTLLFYVKLKKAIVVDPGTRLELSVQDAYGTEYVANKNIRDWMSR